MFLQLTNLAHESTNQKKQWDFFNIGIDSERGVLRIGNQLYKLISYEGPADIDEYCDVTVFVSGTTSVNNPEYQSVITDSDEKVLWGQYTDGTETDIDLTGYTMLDPSTGKQVKLTTIINGLKNVNE